MAELTDAPLPTPEENFAGNMKVLREAEGWNQSELARRITEAGLPGFHQTTVSRIEKGERPVRLGEATVIAGVFRVPVERLTGDPVVLGHIAGIRAAFVAADERRDELKAAARAFDEAVKHLRAVLGDPAPDADGGAHSPWRVVHNWEKGQPSRVYHDGYEPETAEQAVREARSAVRASEAMRIASIVNENPVSIVQYWEVPF